MIKRDISSELVLAAREYPVVTILGPRQSGKTTLARMTFPDLPYFSLENPDTRQIAQDDPRAFLEPIKNGAILDEIQRLPLLLSYLQGIVDEPDLKSRFILTGSHQPLLQEAISQSLAGRTAILTLWPFSLGEIRTLGSNLDPFDLMVRGTYPRLHHDGLQQRRFYNSYFQTYVERDVRALINVSDLAQFQKFLTLLAGRVGQLINLTSLSNDTGVSATTIRKWVNVLKASYIIFELLPYFENTGKRLIKSPKLYFTDVGLASYLLGIADKEQAFRDPIRGQLYENLVIAELVKGAMNRGLRPDVFFYRDSNGNEVDVLIKVKGQLIPVEIKSASTYTKSFAKGLKHFQQLRERNQELGVILYNGDQNFTVQGIQVKNPLSVENLWLDLTETSEASKTLGHP
jgi:uncharacterized protein